MDNTKSYSKSDKDKLNTLINKLEKYKSDIENINFIHEQKKFFGTMKNFRIFIALEKHQNIYDIFSHSQYFKKFKSFFWKVNMYYLRSLESLQTISIMTKWGHKSNCLIDLLDSQLLRECYERKWEEIKSIDFTSAKNLICVWCWPMPETLLFLFENKKLEKIIWIDIDHEAIFMAWEMISWLKLDNINLLQMNWSDYDYSDIDIVYIPLFVSNKWKLLNKIIETWKKSIQILINLPKWLWNLIYDGLYTVNPRLKITYKSDAFCIYKAQEIIKFEKYNF